MPDLVSLTEVKTFLGVTGSAEDTLLTDLLEHAEALFERQTGRGATPFKAAAGAVTEVHDGTGNGRLFLDYPISTVTAITLGFDTADPDETPDPADKAVVVWAAGSRRLARVDGGTFGPTGEPRYVHVQYTPLDDLPEDAQAAIKRIVAQVYRQRGSEDATSEREGGFAHELARVAAEDPVWRMACDAHWRPVFV